MALRLWRAAVVLAIAWMVRSAARRHAEPPPGLDLTAAREFFSSAASVEPDATGSGVTVRDPAGNTLGTLVSTSPDADDIRGYSGPCEVLVALSAGGTVLDWRLRRSEDTPEHVAKVKSDAAFARSLVGWKPGAPPPNVAVSGATLTSAAVAEAVQKKLGAQTVSLRFPEAVTLEEVRLIFPQAASLDGERVIDAAGGLLGTIVRTSPVADNVTGYQGPTESLVGVAQDGQTVQGIRIRKSYDTPDYVDQVRDDRHFLKSFVGRTTAELAALDYEKEGVEGVSGATRTSYAIAEGLKRRFQQPVASAKKPAEKASRLPVNLTLAVFAAGGVFMAFSGARGRRWVRWLWQIAVVAGVGACLGGLLSQALFIGWLRRGVDWRETWGLLTLAAVALVLPWADGKNVYCHQLCPHGHLQTWMSRPWQRWRVRREGSRPASVHPTRPAVRRAAGALPGLLLAVIAVLATLDPGRSFASWEPFAAWSVPVWLSASLIIALLGLVAAIFWPQAYCHYGCPTGALLRFVRHRGSGDRWRWSDSAAALLLAAVAATTLFTGKNHEAVAAAATVFHAPPTEGRGRTMGTTWSVKWRGFSGDPDALIRQIQASLDETEAEFSTWRDDSALSRFNAAPERVPLAVSADFLALTRTAAELTRLTDGAYDPTALPLVKLWGFGAAPRRTAIPTEAELAAALAQPRLDTLTIGESSLTKHDPAFQLDLTSVTEGLALKKGAAVLDAAGASEFLLEVGSELTARGAWTVAVERPWRLVRLENATLSTSGTYRQKRNASPGAGSVSHLIDARTGRPVTHGTVSVSVIHADPVLADGWATALAISGAEAGVPLANGQGLAAQFVVERDGAFHVVSTQRWPEAYPATAAVPSGR